MLRRWFDDQGFVVVFNFFSILINYGNMVKMFLRALSISKKYNMIVFLTLQGSAGEWR